MSIAVLNQVYDEVRRLAVAGSVVAKGDFRLKKLVAPLEQAGAKAPVFAKVAESANKVIEGPEDKSAENLLELTSLVTAVLYTQGETGMPGELKPIETVNLGGEMSQTSARMLKPLLEALSSTGSGRLELIKEAHERGAFRDLRLIRPALNGLDDSYSEIADFLAEKVLPMYGKAILPELRRSYDPKGTRGHPRRLRLMHAIDPVGTRELVLQALDGGSKEVKVAAISCLGSEKEDLQYLIEQSKAKAQEVRAAAYEALARLDKPEASAVLATALSGKDCETATRAIRQAKTSRHFEVLVREIRLASDKLFAAKSKKDIGEIAERIALLLEAKLDGEQASFDELLIELFARRDELVQKNGSTYSGRDVLMHILSRMADGSETAKRTLADAHPELTGNELSCAFLAAMRCYPPARVYDMFSTYLTASDSKQKGREAHSAKKEAITYAIGGVYVFHTYDPHDTSDEARTLFGGKRPTYDPRWLDLAVAIKSLSLVYTLARPGHSAAMAFAKSAFDAAVKKTKTADTIREPLMAMIALQHPDSVDAFFTWIANRDRQSSWFVYWTSRLIPRLPKSALPRLEEMVTKLPDHEADPLLDSIQKLRAKS